MSAFIVPMASLPSITSLSELRQQQNVQMADVADKPFADFLQDAIQDMAQTGETARGTMLDLALGGSDDLHTGALTAVKSSTAINFTTSMLSTAIRSYNELMRMQV